MPRKEWGGSANSEKSQKGKKEPGPNGEKKAERKPEKQRQEYDYEILGVPENATPEEIAVAYRKRARETHPDMGGDAEEFKKVQGAYESLINRQRNGGKKETSGRKEEGRGEEHTGRTSAEKSEREKRFEEMAKKAEENIRKARQEYEEYQKKMREDF